MYVLLIMCDELLLYEFNVCVVSMYFLVWCLIFFVFGVATVKEFFV